MTIDRYAHTLLQGIGAAALQLDCDLLLGCGFSVSGNSPEQHSFWPVAGPAVDFVPVGPWNTDGLIIIPDDLSQEQSQYVGDLLAAGFPIIFTTPEGPGPVVAVDNTHGIGQAFTHLWEHGHRQIAFIAGNYGQGGDSAERLRAYRQALREVGLTEDPRLIAFGEHRRDGGAIAMQQILASGAPFTALMASNDLSCLGAMQQLSAAGRRIPDDVAVIGFDDILDARSWSPSLTTVRHPTFQLGYQAVQTLLEYIDGRRSGAARVIISPRLIVRQSCGCRSAAEAPSISGPPTTDTPASLDDLARAMAGAAWIDGLSSSPEEIEAQCTLFVAGLVESLTRQSADISVATTQRALAWTEARWEGGQLWQAGITYLYQNLDRLLQLTPRADPAFASGLLDRLRLQIGDQIQRQTTRALLAHMDLTAQLGLMTAELLTAMNVPESAEILARHLPLVGIQNALVALYQGPEEDESAQSVVLISAGLPSSVNGRRFEPRKFPLRDIYPAHQPLRLTLLPLALDGDTSGFVAFSAPNPELCAAIVHNLTAALRASRLYGDALAGRRLAEEANQLKSRFLSMVSHELRTPLSLIVGLSDMVLRERSDAGALAAGARQDIEQINLSAQHLGRLLSDVLDLASSEAGQLRLNAQPLDLAEVLRVAAATGQQMAEAKGLAWQAHLPASGPWVMGDRTRLRQVVLNLVSNAVKFSERGEVRLDVVADHSQVMVSVTDPGIGIAPDEQELVFQEFHRSERSVQGGFGGLGLGLAVCKQLVQRHGGSVGIESPVADGRGSRVYFTLPVMSERLAAPPLAVAAGARPQTVVLLGGETEAGHQVQGYLEGRGFEVHTRDVDPNSKWLAAVVALQPVAIVMDEGLAQRQGWELIGAIKRQSTTESIPILVYALEAGQDQGELLEVNYLLKPLGLDQLRRELERYRLVSQHTVLVVDDDPEILSLHSRLVEQAGYRVALARTGREALAAVQSVRPDLILLDLMMPEMDGFEVLEQLRRHEATRGIPVIVITGQLLTEAEMQRLNHGVAAILSKGIFTTDETLGRIEAALARQNSFSSTAQRFVPRAIAFIQAHFAEPITRDDIARHIAVSGNYLTECFRQALGITPMTFLTRYRLQRAQQLLDSTDLSITEIAAETGFAEISHFTHTFKRETGISPHAYRRGQRPHPGKPDST
jgi:signal transduction histidine kinase/CheY-like chemotaxis protein